MKWLGRIQLAVKATRELGVAQTFWYSVYQLGLRSGYYRQATPAGDYLPLTYSIRSPFPTPDSAQLSQVLGDQKLGLLREAEELIAGKIRLFAGQPVPLDLIPPDYAHHWTYYEGKPETWGVEDVKYLWEPARFGWAYTLGRAYLLTRDERYAASFWEHFETFHHHNPPNQGPNWMSAQEVGLRLMALLFASCAFNTSGYTTPERTQRLAGSIAAHAQRIPCTLSYALAQNNNHLISETLGLYAAGCALPGHPQAASWRQKGWYWLNHALQSQIQNDGIYSQHSMNYHRLMLQAALQAPLFGKGYPKKTNTRLIAAARWLLAQVDPTSGRTPNLGSNDGALILPLAPGGYADYRPVAQAASRAFFGRAAFPAGPWDELGLWLGQKVEHASNTIARFPESKAVYRLGSAENWGTLRAVNFRGRPSQADQLHVDLWWRGENIALDAGTYRYTAAPPWDNSLARTRVHNTIEVNGQDQMHRAGKFLWLNWAQAKVLDTQNFQSQTLAAEHDGYRRIGVIHRRVLKLLGRNHWQVTDHLIPSGFTSGEPYATPYTFRLHWLLPDWPWELDGRTLTLDHPAGGKVKLTLTHLLPSHPLVKIGRFSLVRAGVSLAGPRKVSPIHGWYSPTYGHKVPALSFQMRLRSPLPVTLLSDWILEE